MGYKYTKTDMVQHNADELNCCVKGAIQELEACAYFLSLGFEVFRNVSPSGKGDIVIWRKGEKPIVIDVKTAGFSKVNEVKTAIRQEDGTFSLFEK